MSNKEMPPFLQWVILSYPQSEISLGSSHTLKSFPWGIITENLMFEADTSKMLRNNFFSSWSYQSLFRVNFLKHQQKYPVTFHDYWYYKKSRNKNILIFFLFKHRMIKRSGAITVLMQLQVLCWHCFKFY